MSFMSMEPSNQTFQEMMSNGVKYQIPRFQRDYAWGQEQWENLWSDVETLPQEKYHYMGYVVLQRKNQHDYAVIDGQQRLVTLSLIILAAMKQIDQLILPDQQEVANNKERLDELRRRFIGTKNPITLTVDNKLSLNRNNDTYFRKICAQLEVPNMRGLTSTNKLLKQAFDFFLRKNFGKTGKDIATFIEQLGETDFLRYHHNFQSKLVTKKDLFSSVRRLADSPQTAYVYLNSLGDYAPVYVSLGNPNDDWWRNQNPIYQPAKSYLEGLKLFNIKQPFTILMTAFFNFTPEEFVKLCHYILVLSIRYNVICHRSPNEQETKYNQLAMGIYQKELKRASHVKNSPQFKELYPDDKTFYHDFEFHKMPSRQTANKIRFLLAQIETYLGHPVNEINLTLEHICPYHPTEKWINDFGEGYEEVRDRLGNRLLLPKSENKQLDTLPFAQKREIYRQTNSKLAAKVAEYEQWNKQAVDNFQSWLAKQAVQIWRVDYKTQ
jgi:hypothetical protein